MIDLSILKKDSRQLIVTFITAVWSIFLLFQNNFFDFFIISIMYFIQIVFYKNSITINLKIRYLISILFLGVGYALIYSVIRLDYFNSKMIYSKVLDHSSIFIIMIIFFVFIFTITQDLIGTRNNK